MLIRLKCVDESIDDINDSQIVKEIAGITDSSQLDVEGQVTKDASCLVLSQKTPSTCLVTLGMVPGKG